MLFWVKPAFIVAKGGITSSDIGVKGLKISRGWVLGQIRPGIPVWEADENSRFYSLDKHNELQDFTADEELEYYRSCTESVENDLLVAFKTKRSNLFKLKGEILELEAVKIHVPTIRTPYMSGYASIPRQFINEVYKNMVQKRHLIESSKAMGIQTIPLCRTANQKELRLLE